MEHGLHRQADGGPDMAAATDPRLDSEHFILQQCHRIQGEIVNAEDLYFKSPQMKCNFAEGSSQSLLQHYR